MTNKNLFLALAVATMLPLQFAMADPIDLDLQVRIIDHKNNDGGHRTPILPPSTAIDDGTLYFYTPCDGCELRITDEDGDVVYSTIIPPSTSSIDLPADLDGTYELQVIRGNFCFYADVTL